MAKHILDFSNYAEQQTSEGIQAGKYLARITKAVDSESKNGNTYILLNMQVIGGPKEHVDSKSVLVDRLTLSDNALFRMANFLPAIGIPVDKKVAFDSKQFIGKKVVAIVDMEEYQGQPRPAVKRYAPVSTWEGELPAAPATAAADDFEEDAEEVSTVADSGTDSNAAESVSTDGAVSTDDSVDAENGSIDVDLDEL
nr:MAG TPA: Protein of unknown function (DUF669) [Caudoviricetes sp.]